MPSIAAAGSVSSLLASLHALVKRSLTLVTEEGRQAGLRLLSTLGLALLAAGLAITGGLGLLAGIFLALVLNDIVSGGRRGLRLCSVSPAPADLR